MKKLFKPKRIAALAAVATFFMSCRGTNDTLLQESQALAANARAVTLTNTFIIPANKAYAEPFAPDPVGVSIPVGYPEDKGVVSNWTNKNRSVVYYLYQTKGEYNLSIENTVNKGRNLNYQINISGCYSGLSATPSQQQITFSGTGTKSKTLDIKVTIGTTGYYRYELKPVSEPNNSIIIHNLVFNALQNESQVNQTNYQSSPSVHASYSSASSTSKSYDWLYQEVKVPEGMDPLYTFYMAIGFYRGYLGIQTNSTTERRVLFSVWDSKDADNDPTISGDDYVKLVDKGDGVTDNSFGNEGTGGQTYINAQWKTGKTVSFIMNVLQEKTSNSVLLSAWYKLEDQTGWNYIATWRAPKEQRYFDGFYSFLENFGYSNGQLRREAEYFNSWAKENSSGNWISLNKAGFTNTDGAVGQRVDYEQGISPNNANRFYMSSGGYTPTIKVQSAAIPLSTTPPAVNLEELKKRVDQAITKQPQSIIDGGIYKIVSAVNNSSVLDVNSYTPTNGTTVSLWSGNTPVTNNQKWIASKNSDGSYTFKSMANNTKVLDVKDNNTSNGASIIVYENTGGDNQKWNISSAGNGYYNIIPKIAADKNLDVNGGFTANGTKIQLWTKGTGNSQKFKFELQK
ncbi:hypothetical protein BAS06_08200 [Elizabethkingia miricola]|uniref:DUF3472 domain-containing protein n=1 Tax=Elizabethkingia miricola TaxID=172045 RepID=UPI00099A81AE|nr:DUF3472 domain-containing protein [Elizabethkingia miricola]OPB90302.1 hypothetical protein BAS06_08200 [Elizabethkingia miricola]